MLTYLYFQAQLSTKLEAEIALFLIALATHPNPTHPSTRESLFRQLNFNLTLTLPSL